MKVKNINGTSQHKCACGSWLKHWHRFSGQSATICRAKGCTRNDLVGAHVQKNVTYDYSWYIVPFCNKHNKSSLKVELVNGTKLIEARKTTNCGS